MGLTISETLNWSHHIEKVCTRSNKKINLLLELSQKIPRRTEEKIFRSLKLPVLEYGNILYDSAPLKYLNNLDKVQRRAALVCNRAYIKEQNH